MTEDQRPRDPAPPDYKNSRPFDVHRWSEHPQLRGLTDDIFQELVSAIPQRADYNDHRKHLRVLLLDLYHRYLEDPDGWIGLSLNRNNYSGPRRYNKLFLSFRPTARLIGLLRERAFIDFKPGFNDRIRGIGYQSRFRAAERLRNIFAPVERDVGAAPFNEHIEEANSEELLILRDSNKNNIDYAETAQTQLMRNKLRAYNDFLRGTYIDIDLRGWPSPETIDLTNKSLHRVFNNGSWEEGGRFYGGWWENISRDLRKKIVIFDKRTIEIDYSALHAVLLYAKEGIDYFQQMEMDPYLNGQILAYQPPDEGSYRRIRDLLKTLWQCSINARDRTAAVGAVRQEVGQEMLREIPVPLEELVDRFVAYHKPIERYFFSGIGLRLQFVDSCISEEIMDGMIFRERLAVLPIHDSYICSIRDATKLRALVGEALTKVLANNGWRAVSTRTKEKLGQIYGERQSRGSADGFVNDDLEEILREMNSDLERRRLHWHETRQQFIVRYVPPENT
jgi:hypothetical protein